MQVLTSQGRFKVTLCHQGNSLRSLLKGLSAKSGSVIYCNHRGNSFLEQLKTVIPIARSRTVVDNRTSIEESRKKFRRYNKANILANLCEWTKTKIKNTNK